MKIKAEFHNGVEIEWEGEDLTFTPTIKESLVYEIKRGSDLIGVAIQPLYIVVDEDADADD